MRHGYYLSPRCCAGLGTKRVLPKMRMKTDKSPSPRMRRTNGRSQEHLPGPGHPAKAPDIWPQEHLPLQLLHHQVPTGPRHPARQARTSGPASPDIQPFLRSRISGLLPGNPDTPEPESNMATFTSPDIWHSANARTSGPTPGCPASLSAHSKGPMPVYPFSPLDYIYSIPYNFLGLANV